MGWGITIKGVFVSRVRKDEIAGQLEELEESIARTKQELMVLAFDPALEDDNWYAYYVREFNTLMESLEEDIGLRTLLNRAQRDMDNVKDS